MDFDELRAANTRRDQESYQMCREWTLADWGLALAGEVGEACNLIKKTRRGEGIPAELIMNEIADVIIYADLLADSLGESLHDAIIRKFNATSNRIGSSITLTAHKNMHHSHIGVVNLSLQNRKTSTEVENAE